MTRFGGIVPATAIACALAAMAATPSVAAAKKHYVRAGAYDGLWSVSIRTQSGPCDAAYRYPARIVGGRVVQAVNDFSYQVSGAVVASGAIVVTVGKGLGTATGFGRLRGTSGFGRWSTAGNQCYGTWSALRRASY